MSEPWLKKKEKKTDNKKFYGYTGPAKPSGYIEKKSNQSYAKTKIVKQKDYVKKEPKAWIKKKEKKEKKESKWIKIKGD
jgi:hypothetical protein